MRRKRKQRNVLSVSLFPFLAVLICTLGALIVFLVLAVKAAEHDARVATQEQRQFDELQTDQLQSELDLQLIRIEGLRQVRPEAISKLERAKSLRGHLENEMRQIKDDAIRLATQLQRLKQPDHQTELASLEIEEDQVRQAIDDARNQLADVRSQFKLPEKVTYSIVPHSGTSGTFRRPIYVECTGDAVILQPMGIKLTSKDFKLANLPGNPLDSALLAIREYWNRIDQDNEQGKPYPLLIIRPHGATSYAAARRAMASWDDEFGYELVESEKQLDYGPSDPQLKQEVAKAVEEARRKQSRAAALHGRQKAGSNGSKPGLVASGAHGGFVFDQNEDFGGDSGNARGDFANRQSASRPLSQKQLNGESDSEIAGEQGQRHDNPSAQLGGQPGGSAATGSPIGSIADRRGQNWALPSRSPGGTGYVRPIRVYCSADQLVIESARKRVVLPIEDSIESTIDPLVDEIWKMIERWGVAAAGGYWKPQLRTTVIPGGEANFARLYQLLDRSGLDLQEVQQP